MRRRLFYPKIRLTDLALIAFLAVLTALPTLHVAAYAKTKAAAELKSAYVLNWGADVWALQAAIRSGERFNPEFLRLFSYGFVHMGPSHLVNNLVLFVPLWWITARRVGGVWTVADYLSGLVMSCLLHLISTPPAQQPSGHLAGCIFCSGFGWYGRFRTA
ncbi:rhomboid family intramembrane serine protease [Thioclava sp. FR2]|uniref:rhomboid family intramembrane serine protease n=1 Tax=Thioclava sp. FR2 TaxID=3445780 RepID=UPI003EBF20FD